MSVLIIYSSRYGSTKDCVEKLAASIKGTVDCVNILTKIVPPLANYKVVILGGPVRNRRVSTAIRAFCLAHYTELSSRKVGLFLLAIARYERAMDYLTLSFPRWIRDQAFAKESFGGNLDLKKLGIFDRFAMRYLARIKWSRSNLNPSAIDRMAKAVNRILET